MSFPTISAETTDSKVLSWFDMVCFVGTELKAVVVIGPEQSCKAIFACLNGNKALVKVGTTFATKCDFHYTRKHTPLPCRWAGMLIASKDPRCLWNDEPASLLAAIKRLTETPFLEEWEPYLRQQLISKGKLNKFQGRGAIGSHLEITTEELDAIVVDGIKAGHISIYPKDSHVSTGKA